MRRAHHGNVVAEFGGVFGKPQGLNGRLDPCTSDQHFVRRGRLTRGLQPTAPLLVGKQDRLASRAEHDDTGTWSARITLNIALELLEVHVAVRIERRGDGRENTVK